jgi:hypothetical protein
MCTEPDAGENASNRSLVDRGGARVGMVNRQLEDRRQIGRRLGGRPAEQDHIMRVGCQQVSIRRVTRIWRMAADSSAASKPARCQSRD